MVLEDQEVEEVVEADAVDVEPEEVTRMAQDQLR